MKLKSISEELAFLYKKGGNFLSPHLVVEYAANKNTLLHSRFTWDDTKAAYLYRLEEARRIIRLELTVVKTEPTEETNSLTVRLYHSLPESRKSEEGYRSVKDILNDPKLRQELLDMALKELSYFTQKYRSINELDKVFQVIEQTLEGHKTELVMEKV